MTDTSGLQALMGAFGLVYMAIMILLIASLWVIFTKAGKPGWASLIPIYNTIVLLQIIGKPAIWLLWLCLPGVNVIFSIWSLNLLSKSFGKSEGYTVGLILLGIVFFPMLAFGDAKYQGPAGS